MIDSWQVAATGLQRSCFTWVFSTDDALSTVGKRYIIRIRIRWSALWMKRYRLSVSNHVIYLNIILYNEMCLHDNDVCVFIFFESCQLARVLHCVSKKVPTFKFSVTLSNLNQFSKFLHCWKAYDICYKIWHRPPHLMHVATIPWKIKNSNFCRYSADMEENACVLHSNHL